MGTMIIPPVSLGDAKKGKVRLAVLRQWAQELGLTWNGQPSISKLIQHLADQRAQEKAQAVENQR